MCYNRNDHSLSREKLSPWLSKNKLLLLSSNQQNPKVVLYFIKMVSHLVACTLLIQMAEMPCKCCVTWPRTVEVGLFFRDVWTALLISIEIGRPTKMASEIYTASSGLEMTIFIVWQPLVAFRWELTWRTSIFIQFNYKIYKPYFVVLINFL